MASIGTQTKFLPKRKKASLFVIISFFVCLLILGIRVSYAYYRDSSSIRILSNLVGDFDWGEGDINIMIYKENDEEKFEKIYAVPAIGYKFNDTLTTCTIPCDTDSSSACYYQYDSVAQAFSLSSDQRVTCKFYFEQEAKSDINVYIMKEDVNGSFTYDSKNYALVESVPAYGYEYNNAVCDNGAIASFDSSTKKFSVSSTSKTTCFAYFKSVGNADIIANVYVQDEEGSAKYELVNSIPAYKVYKLSTSKTSWCYDSTGTGTNATISYADGYINVSATGKQTCDIYLDLDV